MRRPRPKAVAATAANECADRAESCTHERILPERAKGEEFTGGGEKKTRNELEVIVHEIAIHFDYCYLFKFIYAPLSGSFRELQTTNNNNYTHFRILPAHLARFTSQISPARHSIVDEVSAQRRSESHDCFASFCPFPFSQRPASAFPERRFTRSANVPTAERARRPTSD